MGYFDKDSSEILVDLIILGNVIWCIVILILLYKGKNNDAFKHFVVWLFVTTFLMCMTPGWDCPLIWFFIASTY